VSDSGANALWESPTRPEPMVVVGEYPPGYLPEAASWSSRTTIGAWGPSTWTRFASRSSASTGSGPAGPGEPFSSGSGDD
jgi:hypothetical protein